MNCNLGALLGREIMHLLSRLYINAVLPACEPMKYAKLGKRLHRYDALERLPLADNMERQWIALKRLVEHAYNTTEFYRSRFDEAGIVPERIKSPEDLRKIPLLTRDDIREHSKKMISSDFSSDQLRRSATGGTTDTPVSFFSDYDGVREKIAAQIRLNTWAGHYPGDKVFLLWGAQSDFPKNPSWRWRLFDRYIMRKLWAPASLLNERTLESYRHTFNTFRPDVVIAYPWSLIVFCEYLAQKGSALHQPRSVICTAEPLLPSQRAFIEATLGCAVFEHYGSREFGMIAGECELHSGLHINPALAYVEVVPIGGSDSELAEVLVTDLVNYGMPLIRYQVNDCCNNIVRRCSCGRGYPLIGSITGRTADVFYLPDGSMVPGVSLTSRVIQVCPTIKKVQIIQHKPAEFLIRYVPAPEFCARDLSEFERNLRSFLGEGVHFDFKAVEDIPREKSGKTRFCISHVQRPEAGRVVSA